MKVHEIRIRVELDDKSIPVKITWSATDKADQGEKEAKAVALTFWDKKEENALRIDLWNKEMRIDEMDKMIFETLMTLSDSYRKATSNDKGADDLKSMANAFGKNAGIIS